MWPRPTYLTKSRIFGCKIKNSRKCSQRKWMEFRMFWPVRAFVCSQMKLISSVNPVQLQKPDKIELWHKLDIIIRWLNTMDFSSETCIENKFCARVAIWANQRRWMTCIILSYICFASLYMYLGIEAGNCNVCANWMKIKTKKRQMMLFKTDFQSGWH